MILLISTLVLSTTIGSLTFDFNRSISYNDTSEVVTGSMFYTHRGKSVVEVQSPIKQYMIFDDTSWVIYYPERFEAYRLINKIPFQIPFIDILFSSLKEDFGMLEKGFLLLSHSVNNDTIRSVWSQDAPEKLFKIILTQINKRYASFELNINDTTRVKTSFQEYHNDGAYYVPVKIKTTVYPGWINSTEGFTEFIIIDNIKYNIDFPEKIINFRLPKNIEVQTLE